MPTWGEKAVAVSVVAEAAAMQKMEDDCNVGIGRRAISLEGGRGRRARDVPAWGAAAAAMTATQALSMTEVQAKAWLAKLDAPVWGKAAKTLANFVDAAALRQMEEDCTAGDDVARLDLDGGGGQARLAQNSTRRSGARRP